MLSSLELYRRGRNYDTNAAPDLSRPRADDGHAVIAGEGRSERIRYIAADHSERWSDPEEKVRAELWAELIYKYEYPPERMGFEVTLPDRTPTRYTDLVIYRDDELKSPYFVFECKKGDVSDAEFDQSIEQAVGIATCWGHRTAAPWPG